MYLRGAGGKVVFPTKARTNTRDTKWGQLMKQRKVRRLLGTHGRGSNVASHLTRHAPLAGCCASESAPEFTHALALLKKPATTSLQTDHSED
jgi:hypothetical protein